MMGISSAKGNHAKAIQFKIDSRKSLKAETILDERFLTEVGLGTKWICLGKRKRALLGSNPLRDTQTLRASGKPGEGQNPSLAFCLDSALEQAMP